jgi:hypothetical protein
MITNLKTSLRQIKDSKHFKEWSIKHPESYLTSAFFSNDWQLDFYCPKEDNMTSFTKTGKETSDIFRKEKREIPELKLEEIEVDVFEAKEIMKKLLKQKYEDQKPTKEIIILQKIEHPTWNITFITEKFNILNVKIDAISGKIISEKLESALSFQAQ